jgi:hypothetical protein
MMIDPLVPGGLAGWLGRVFGVLRREFDSLAALALVPAGLTFAYLVSLGAVRQDPEQLRDRMEQAAAAAGGRLGPGAAFEIVFGRMLPVLGTFSLLMIIAWALYQCAAMFTVVRGADHQPVPRGAAWAFAAARAPALIGWSLLGGLAFTVTTALPFVPGLLTHTGPLVVAGAVLAAVLAVPLGVALVGVLPGVAVIERAGPRRAWALLRGRLVATTVRIAVAGALYLGWSLLANAITAGVAGLAGPGALAALVQATLLVPVLMFQVAVTTVTYAELRNRDDPSTGTRTLAGELHTPHATRWRPVGTHALIPVLVVAGLLAAAGPAPDAVGVRPAGLDRPLPAAPPGNGGGGDAPQPPKPQTAVVPGRDGGAPADPPAGPKKGAPAPGWGPPKDPGAGSGPPPTTAAAPAPGRADPTPAPAAPAPHAPGAAPTPAPPAPRAPGDPTPAPPAPRAPGDPTPAPPAPRAPGVQPTPAPPAPAVVAPGQRPDQPPAPTPVLARPPGPTDPAADPKAQVKVTCGNPATCGDPGAAAPDAEPKKAWTWKDTGHTVLDGAGMVPVVQEAANGINTVWYAAEGDWTNAGISAAGLVPFAGDAAVGARLGAKGAKLIKGAGDAEGAAADATKAEKVTGDTSKLAQDAQPPAAATAPGAGPGGDAAAVARPGGVKPDWVASPARNGKGTVYQSPGASGNASQVRVMDPGADPRYPDGYVRFYNDSGQPLSLSGKPGPNSETHIPRNPDGTYELPQGW